MSPASPTAALTPAQILANDVLARIDLLLQEAERQTKPLEVQPYRGQLFELFVIADASGLMKDESRPNLAPETLSRSLAERWGLSTAAVSSHRSQSKMSPEHLSKMRLLWSFLRMWMEWQYAWSRWSEFNDGAAKPPSATEATATSSS